MLRLSSGASDVGIEAARVEIDRGISRVTANIYFEYIYIYIYTYIGTFWGFGGLFT